MSRKYNVMVVEDEEIERNALAMMLRYQCRDVGEVWKMENGLAAIEALKNFTPDIVLMDINLPGIDGLDTIRQMRQINAEIRFVIISAHSQFAYAQEALRLGVYDFLVKPIGAEEVRRVLGGMIDQMERSRTRLETEKIQRQKMDAIRPVLESDCVFSIASMRSNSPLEVIFDFMQIRVNSGYVFLIRGAGQGNLLLNEVKNQMHSLGTTCIGEIINDVCVFVALSEYPLVRSRVQETMRHIADALQRRHISCHIGVGDVAVCADDLRRSYEQGIAAVRYAAAHGERLAFHDELRGMKETALEDLTATAARICEEMRQGDRERVAGELRNFFAAVQLGDGGDRRACEQAYCLYIMVYGSFPELAGDSPPLTSDRVFSYKDMQALRDMLIEVFAEMTDQLKGQSASQSNRTAAAAMQIVDARYMENLTLDDIAEELNFSIFYLSKLFKKQTGMTFTEYLTKCRVEKAKEFLSEGKMSVKEVAFATGYHSQGYFSKIFRKYTGVSPSEYKQ